MHSFLQSSTAPFRGSYERQFTDTFSGVAARAIIGPWSITSFRNSIYADFMTRLSTFGAGRTFGRRT